MRKDFRALALAALLASVPAAAAQTATAQPSTNPAAVCGQPIGPPANLPPAGSGPVVWLLVPCFEKQGGTSTIEAETYLYYIRVKDMLSRPSQNVWVPYDEKIEQVVLSDFKSLWATNFLDDLAMEVVDYTFPNGVIGKILLYHMEERERVKIVQYEGTKVIDRAKIDEQLRERGIEIRLDSFLDEGKIRRVKSVLREMMAEKGYTDAVITHTTTPVAGGPKLVNIAFHISEGPKIKIRDVEFVGNRAFSDGRLQRRLKENKPRGLFGWITGSGTWKEAAYEEDVARIVDFYRDRGYAKARVGNPEVRVLEDRDDGKTRWVQLRIPVEEGPRYRFGRLTFEGNKLFNAEALASLYDVEPGEWYSRKKITDGNRKASELYGRFGYIEFNPFPVHEYSDDPDPSEAALAALAAQVPPALAEPAQGPNAGGGSGAPAVRATAPTVDVVMQIQEGPQYTVNRITFVGNTTTRDHVIRREMRLLEGHVFDTEALKYSIRRLNQLGYFKQLEGNDKDTKVEKAPGRENAMDITVRLEEQNRNQLTFGAGVSQYEGFFGQLAFQTANFMGRGESLTVSLTAGDRSQNYQLAFTEPFLFDRNITGGFDVYKRSLQFIGAYTQKATGGNLVFGFPVADFSRMFFNYSYETIKMSDLNEAFIDSSCLLRPEGCSIISSLADLSQLTPVQRDLLARNPFVHDSLLIGQGGRRSISRITPSFVFNTVDHPIFPNTGRRLTASIDLALFGGNTHFYKPRLEAVAFFRHTLRTSLGLRGQVEYIAPARGTTALPVFERLFLGGEYSVRGYDIRSIGPSIPGSPGVVLGGNKSLLFNAEYLISVANQVRLVLFFDAGQVRDVGQRFAWKEDVTTTEFPAGPALVDPLVSPTLLHDPNAPGPITKVIGRTSAFKTSTGIELRFFMPVLNVPFRLIYAWNPHREGVYDNSFRPAQETTFRFAVGTTF
jgi:outer membrane protein insertion porin family